MKVIGRGELNRIRVKGSAEFQKEAFRVAKKTFSNIVVTLSEVVFRIHGKFE